MMKIMKLWALLLILSLAALASGCGDSGGDRRADAPQASNTAEASSAPAAEASDTAPSTDPVPVYRDGTYEVATEKDFEGYFVKASLTIKDGRISDFHYDIYDSNNGNALFDEKYEDYMPSQYYKQQCRDDLKGMKTYGPKLIETQSVEDVDVVSKATWTWKLFKKAAGMLLEQAAVK